MGKVRVDKRCRLHFRARETTKPETSTVISSEADKAGIVDSMADGDIQQ